MVCNGSMGNIGFAGRHMASDATILLILFPALPFRKRATLFTVTMETAIPVVGHPLFGGGQLVRIVTACAAHAITACSEAAAGVHLLDMADKLFGFRRALP